MTNKDTSRTFSLKLPMAAPRVEPTKRIYSLDLLRGLASLGVCWFHLTSFHYPTPDGPIYHLVRASGAHGWLGVEVFFVISGFVIPYSLNRVGYKVKGYLTFILKRVLRLDPPYLITIALILVLAYAYAFYSGRAPLVENSPIGPMRVLLHLGYLNMFFGYAWLNPSFWTLAIEFQYYLMMGLAFSLINSRRRIVRISALACFAATSFFSVHDFLSKGVPYSWFIFYFAFLFVMGIVTFQRHARVTGAREYAVLLLITAAGAFLTVGVGPTLAGLFAVIVINFYKKQNLIARFFGNISYSLYLLHWPLGHLTLSIVGSKLLGATGDGARIVVLAFALVVCLASSYVLYLLVEKPAQRWSASIGYRPARNRAPLEEVSGLPPTLMPESSTPG